MPPLIGLGTYQLKEDACVEIIQTALAMGYRHIDTAFLYENQREIGEAIRGFPREELFLTSKFTVDLVLQNGSIERSVENILDRALQELQTEYLDLMLVHWPELNTPLEAIFSALNRQTSKGKLRAAGGSNYTRHHLQDIYNIGLSVPYNQVEFHPYLYQKELLDFCKANGTQLVAHRPLGKGELLSEPLFRQIAQRYARSPAQVILRWIIEKGIPVIVKASKKEHIKENLSVLDFSLSNEEIEEIDALHCARRFCAPDLPLFNY